MGPDSRTSAMLGNASNLYSTVLTFSTIKQTGPLKKNNIVSGVIGIGAALLGFSDYLLSFLNFLGILALDLSAPMPILLVKLNFEKSVIRNEN